MGESTSDKPGTSGIFAELSCKTTLDSGDLGRAVFLAHLKWNFVYRLAWGVLNQCLHFVQMVFPGKEPIAGAD